jgi:hypothetical protein
MMYDSLGSDQGKPSILIRIGSLIRIFRIGNFGGTTCRVCGLKSKSVKIKELGNSGHDCKAWGVTYLKVNPYKDHRNRKLGE